MSIALLVLRSADGVETTNALAGSGRARGVRCARAAAHFACHVFTRNTACASFCTNHFSLLFVASNVCITRITRTLYLRFPSRGVYYTSMTYNDNRRANLASTTALCCGIRHILHLCESLHLRFRIGARHARRSAQHICFTMRFASRNTTRTCCSTVNNMFGMARS